MPRASASSMRLLDVPFDRARAPARPLAWPAGLEVTAATLALIVAGLALERAGGPLGSFWRAMTGAAAHAGLLGLGWIVVDGHGPGWRAPVLRLGGVLVVAFLASRTAAWGPLAYLAVPVALLVDAGRRREFAQIGFTWPRPRAAALGLGAGAFLGIHLLATASLTLGYAVRLEASRDYLAAVAYDVCVNAVTSEWLFRGAVFSWSWRRWAFAPAAALSTGLAVLRYALDPNLPSAVEVWLGAGFYTGVLGVGACALRAWSGSLVPGYLATAAFFLAYRALGH